MNLDLEFLATGARQHAFVRTGQEEDGQVYKIPASFGCVLPFDQPTRWFKARNLYEQVLVEVLFCIPRFFCSRLDKGFDRLINRCSLRSLKAIVNVTKRLYHLPLILGKELVAAYWKRDSLKIFQAMLELIEYLHQHGVQDVLLPCRIIRNGEARLHVNGAVRRYKGPILIQRRGDLFFDHNTACPLESFEWREVVESQHKLWRHGIALGAPAEIIGPTNWSLLDGHLYLGDTGALIKDFRCALDLLNEETLAKKSTAVLKSLLEVNSREPAEAYICFVRKNINQDKLNELWRTALDAKNP